MPHSSYRQRPLLTDAKGSNLLLFFALLTGALALTTPNCQADELSVYAGALKPEPNDTDTYSWQLEYRRPLFDDFAASFSWLNEGHITNHHRDGQAIQGWWRSKPMENIHGLSFDLGIGPYRYYDTSRPIADERYQNLHGWGVLASAGANYRFDDHWIASLRINQVDAHGSFDTTALLAGVGYNFGGEGASGDAFPDRTLAPAKYSWEFDGVLGDAILNSFKSQAHTVGGLGARVQLTDWLSASGTYINAGENDTGWRDAAALQLWAEQNVTRHVSVGVSLGAFFPAHETINSSSTSHEPSALVGVEAGYSFSKQWIGRFIWDRVGTGDSHDADIFLFNVGYRF
jgi:hypothetical protein